MSKHQPTIKERLKSYEVPKALMTVLSQLADAGYEAFCVGGSVRDLLMGRPVHDWDVTTSAEPREVIELFSKVIKTGIDHGTVTVIVDQESFEVTTYRVDVGSSDGRRPDAVHFSPSLEEDLKRRDFTMNAIAWDPISGEFVDPHHGTADIEAGLIRAVGDAQARLSEDGLRSLRALRFFSVLGFQLEASLARALSRTVDVFERVSVERIWQEMSKLMLGACASESIACLKEVGMWDRFWPTDAGQSLDGFDDLPLKLELRLVQLFRSCPHLFKESSKSLKLPNRLTKKVLHLLDCLSFDYDPDLEQVERFRVMAKIGLDSINDLSELARVDSRAGFADEVQHFLGVISNPPYIGMPMTVSELPVDGRWILNEFKLKPSPKIGQLLQHCLEEVWRQPALNSFDGCQQILTLAIRTQV